MDHSTSGSMLLVASAGGHLEELLRISQRFAKPGQAVEWVTPFSSQSATLLADDVVHTVPYIGPRDLKMVSRQFFRAIRILGSGRYSAVISTGAAIAVPYLTAAWILNIPTHYIESAARSLKPSLTGRIIQYLPGIKLYTQYECWPSRKWKFQGSVFDGFRAEALPGTGHCRRVVVTLGTMQSYGFGRAVEAVLRVLAQLPEPPEEVLWQTGCTDLTGLPIQGRTTVPSTELVAAIAQADLVIAHAGVGSALAALRTGRTPILLPRQAGHGEHVDDHQLMIARHLAQRGLAICKDPEDLRLADVQLAMSRRVIDVRDAQEFALAT
ncbi:glycosyltransferase [Glutamicibacter arilaitensis]|uniref:glycosyltransferase n=1 Tax=Glutamicibacter arilaitensis TaxID=256701 RepID=UPI003FD1566F